MGIPSDVMDAWVSRKKSLLIASPIEDEKILRSRQCTQEGVRAGVKAAAIASVTSAVPTLIACRTLPWAKANLNYTAQALIISAASIAAYFITADKTILECARRNAQYDRSS
ncbi:early nodulin-related [Forsythia ovata]|uniref:Early nodulin-related n=1 Tax=Forsythia ovata TaxID=205694 RepID=A0ABD1W581_9LAMI